MSQLIKRQFNSFAVESSEYAYVLKKLTGEEIHGLFISGGRPYCCFDNVLYTYCDSDVWLIVLLRTNGIWSNENCNMYQPVPPDDVMYLCNAWISSNINMPISEFLYKTMYIQ